MRRSLADDDAYCCGYGRGFRRGFAAAMKQAEKVESEAAPAEPSSETVRVMLALVDTARRVGARRLEWETPDGSLIWRAS